MKKIILLASLACSLFSCKEDNKEPKDTQAPIFGEIGVNGKLISIDTEGELFADSTNTISVTLTDDMELSEMNLNIHIVDGEHNHDAKARTSEVAEPFTYGPVVKTLKGKSDHVFFSFDIPANAQAGEYHLEIIALDKMGNKKEIIFTNDLGLD
jgi:hypothetical protein